MEKDEIWQSRLRTNLSYISKSTTNLNMIFAIFISKNILSPDEAEEIKNTSKNSHDRVMNFILLLMRKGPNSYTTLIPALRVTCNPHVADQLESISSLMPENFENFEHFFKYLEGSLENPAKFESIIHDVPEYIQVLILKNVNATTHHLFKILSFCSSIALIELNNVSLEGTFDRKVLLRNLRDFQYIDSNNCSKIKGKSQDEKFEFMKSIIFFRKDKKLWEFNRLWNLEVNIHVSIDGVEYIKIKFLTGECVNILADQSSSNLPNNTMKKYGIQIYEANQKTFNLESFNDYIFQNPELITSIYLSNVTIDSQDFYSKISKCVNLNSIILELVTSSVIFNPNCTNNVKRVKIPSLKFFQQNCINSDYGGRAENLIHFYTAGNDRDYYLSDITIEISIEGVNLFSIKSNKFYGRNCNFDNLIEHLDPTLKTLILIECSIDTRKLPQRLRKFEELVSLKLEKVNFLGEKFNDTVYLPRLEEFYVKEIQTLENIENYSKGLQYVSNFESKNFVFVSKEYGKYYDLSGLGIKYVISLLYPGKRTLNSELVYQDIDTCEYRSFYVTPDSTLSALDPEVTSIFCQFCPINSATLFSNLEIYTKLVSIKLLNVTLTSKFPRDSQLIYFPHLAEYIVSEERIVSEDFEGMIEFDKYCREIEGRSWIPISKVQNQFDLNNISCSITVAQNLIFNIDLPKLILQTKFLNSNQLLDSADVRLKKIEIFKSVIDGPSFITNISRYQNLESLRLEKVFVNVEFPGTVSLPNLKEYFFHQIMGFEPEDSLNCKKIFNLVPILFFRKNNDPNDLSDINGQSVFFEVNLCGFQMRSKKGPQASSVVTEFSNNWTESDENFLSYGDGLGKWGLKLTNVLVNLSSLVENIFEFKFLTSIVLKIQFWNCDSEQVHRAHLVYLKKFHLDISAIANTTYSGTRNLSLTNLLFFKRTAIDFDVEDLEKIDIKLLVNGILLYNSQSSKECLIQLANNSDLKFSWGVKGDLENFKLENVILNTDFIKYLRRGSSLNLKAFELSQCTILEFSKFWKLPKGPHRMLNLESIKLDLILPEYNVESCSYDEFDIKNFYVWENLGKVRQIKIFVNSMIVLKYSGSEVISFKLPGALNIINRCIRAIVSKLFLGELSITPVLENFLQTFENLVELFLSTNSKDVLNLSIFSKCATLTKVTISNNKITLTSSNTLNIKELNIGPKATWISPCKFVTSTSLINLETLFYYFIEDLDFLKVIIHSTNMKLIRFSFKSQKYFEKYHCEIKEFCHITKFDDLMGNEVILRKNLNQWSGENIRMDDWISLFNNIFETPIKISWINQGWDKANDFFFKIE